MTTSRWTCLINKDDITDIHLEENLPEPVLGEGEVDVSINRYALTANNITYATLGKSFGSWTDMPGYWAFFPWQDTAFGQLPIWGFATVIRSNHLEIPVGDELYGYFPMASHLAMAPGRISASSLHDLTEHRGQLAPVYNQYTRISGMAKLTQEDKDFWPVFRPLLVTGYMICDQFFEADYYGAEQIVIASASSKTAMMTARCFDQFEKRPRLIGLTSTGNKAFVEETGLYDDVRVYDEADQINKALPTALIDMAGNGAVIDALHHHFTDQLKYSCLVGISHWDSARPSRDLPGAPITPFFAPGRLKQRSKDWGHDGLQNRLDKAWSHFTDLAGALTTLQQMNGAEAAIKTYSELVRGKVNPAHSLIISQ